VTAATALAPFTLVIDTREQRPYSFEGVAPTVRAGLPAGDYSILGHETAFAIERKAIGDAFSSFTRERDRFKRELEKLQSYELAVILIEASLDDLLDHPPERVAHVRPATVINSLLSWRVDYGVTPIFGSRDRDRCRALVFRLAERFWRRHHAPAPAVTALDRVRAALERQRALCAGSGMPLFVPADGRCPSCRRQVFEREDGRRLVTGCPFCQRSYCD
jgi:ERCC4-type nuclease